MAKYTIVIEKGEGNYSAYCPDLPCVVAAGETEEETAELMKEAIEFHLEGLKEDKMPIPEPTISARSVDLSFSRDDLLVAISDEMIFQASASASATSYLEPSILEFNNLICFLSQEILRRATYDPALFCVASKAIL